MRDTFKSRDNYKEEHENDMDAFKPQRTIITIGYISF